MKYFKVLRNKNPDENPDLPMDFENFDRKSKVYDFCQMFVIAKKKAIDFGTENHGLGLGMKKNL
jgi:hypothetical protein